MTYEDISYEVRGGIARITIQREARLNAFRGQTVEEMTDAFYRAWDDATVGVVVLRGAGSRAFCTGGDQKERQETGTYAFRRGGILGLHEVIRAIPKPVIAAVNGYAIGGGNVLQVLCDLAVAADTATFALPGVNVGVFCTTPAVGVGRNVARKRVMEMLLTGRPIDSATALDWGLLNRVVPSEKLDETVQGFVDAILAKSPAVIRNGKRAFYDQLDRPLADAYATAGKAMTEGVLLEDAAEGMDAFLQKRPPSWRGR